MAAAVAAEVVARLMGSKEEGALRIADLLDELIREQLDGDATFEGTGATESRLPAKHTTETGIEIADHASTLEQAARSLDVVPIDVASPSAGLDRMSVRMGELADPATANPPQRTEPYERTPPLLKEHHYRKAWVGSTSAGSISAYDVEGKELFTLRYAAEADPIHLAERVANDVAWILKARPGIPIQCVQDAAPELARLPEALTRLPPTNTNVVELVDFEHLMGYWDVVVDTCEPTGDPHNMKGGTAPSSCATTLRSTSSGATCVRLRSACLGAAPTATV